MLFTDHKGQPLDIDPSTITRVDDVGDGVHASLWLLFPRPDPVPEDWCELARIYVVGSAADVNTLLGRTAPASEFRQGPPPRA